MNNSLPVCQKDLAARMVAISNAETIGQSSVTNAATTIAANDSTAISSPLPSDDETRTKSPSHVVYNPKKPKWWNRLGNNGRDATKSQKRAMRKVLDREGTTNGTDLPLPPGLALRLPPVPYGSILDWDEIFPNSSEGNRDIWLELGFGRGENLQALLESKLWEEKTQEKYVNITVFDGGGHKHNVDVDAIHVDANNASKTKTKKHYLVGAEVSGVGIGCLCKRIEQLQQLQQQEIDHCNDHYSLYRPEMDPYSSRNGANAITTKLGEKVDSSVTTSGGQIPWIEERNSLLSIYSERLRIHTGDGYKLLPKLPDGCLSAILITFPDPFPKETDVNYRLVQHQTLIECHRILRKGHPCDKNDKNNWDCNGRLFLATDHDGYHEWCHKIMHEVNRNNQDGLSPSSPLLFEMEEPCPNRMTWLPAVSRYEQKGWDEGRSTKLTCWVAI